MIEAGRQRGTPVAKKVSVDLVDDIDGTPAAESIAFSLDGTSYEIDLSEKNATTMRTSMTQWIQKARRTGRSRRSRKTTNLADIRTWAQANGYKVSARGRIAQPVVDAFQQSQNAQFSHQ